MTREEAIKELTELLPEEFLMEYAEAIRMGIEALEQQPPPVMPQPKMGNWFIYERPESDREVVCSNCGQPIFKYHKLYFDYRPKYCPNCGCKMQEV